MEVSGKMMMGFGILCVLMGYSLFMIGNEDPIGTYSERSFIKRCNEQFGEPQWYTVSWVILPVNEYTSYSHELFEENPMIHIGSFGPKGNLYFCDDINNWPKIRAGTNNNNEVNKT